MIATGGVINFLQWAAALSMLGIWFTRLALGKHSTAKDICWLGFSASVLLLVVIGASGATP